jgi:ABC-type Fe3+/spermidine/putrescine transport system ATPase subunit
MLFQNYALFPHMTVAENIAFGLETRGIKRIAAAERVAEALQLVQLPEYGDRMPAQLSGGQQQRVALARALVVEPTLLLLDEPLGALDKALRQSMQVELRSLQRRLGVTTVMVTHDQDEALTMADCIVIMRDGRIEQVGAPAEVYQRPVSRFVAGFLGASNFLRGRVIGRCNGTTLIDVPQGPTLSVRSTRPVGSEVTLALRPEAVVIETAGVNDAAERVPNMTPAVIEQIIYHGFATHLHLRLPNGDPLIAFEQNRGGTDQPPIRPGMEVRARWAPESSQIIRDERRPGCLGHDCNRAIFGPGAPQLGPPSRLRHARATPAMTANEAYAPSASPFSKSPPLTAIRLVTCARHSTGFCRASANA